MRSTTGSLVGTYGTSRGFSVLGATAPVAPATAAATAVRARASRTASVRRSGISGSSFGPASCRQGEVHHAHGQHTDADQGADPGVGEAGVEEIGAGDGEQQRRQRIEGHAE